MNTYRVIFNTGNRKRRYDVDASHPGAAIGRALNGFTTTRTTDVDVSCRLFASDIQWDRADPRVRAL